MKRHQVWLRLFGLVAPVGLISGCLGQHHPVAAPPAEPAAIAAPLPQACKTHVYVFMVHGLDPFDYADLAGLRAHLNSLGYIKTYHGQLYHAPYFAREMRRLHSEDPDARFALMGFSFGANMARNLAQTAGEEG